MSTSSETLAPFPAWLSDQLPLGIERSLVDVGDLHMHAMAMGTGRPVLMVHGNPSWGFLYRKVMAALAGEDFRLIAPDLIGLGFSDKPTDPSFHTIENHSAALAALIEHLDLRDVILVCQDWGGPIGTHAFVDQAERLGGLVILNTVLGPPRTGFRPTAFHRFARLPWVSDAVFRLGGFPQNAMAFAQGNLGSIAGEVARAYRYPLGDVHDRVAPLALARMVPDSDHHPSIAPLRECEALVSSFTGPVSIVWGDKDPVLGSVIRHMERIFPAAEVTRTDAGHFLQEEVPEEIAAAVRSVASRSAA